MISNLKYIESTVTVPCEDDEAVELVPAFCEVAPSTKHSHGHLGKMCDGGIINDMVVTHHLDDHLCSKVSEYDVVHNLQYLALAVAD